MKNKRCVLARVLRDRKKSEKEGKMDKRDIKELKLLLLVICIWGLLFCGKWIWQKYQHFKEVEKFYDFYFNTMENEGE